MTFVSELGGIQGPNNPPALVLTDLTKYSRRTKKLLNIYKVLHKYSNKKETSNFYGTVSFNLVSLSQYKYNQNVSYTSDKRKFNLLI